MDEKHAANLFSEIMETPKPSYKELLEELEKKKEQYFSDFSFKYCFVWKGI